MDVFVRYGGAQPLAGIMCFYGYTPIATKNYISNISVQEKIPMLRWGGTDDSIVLPENQLWDINTNYKENIYKNNLTNIRSVMIPGQSHAINSEDFNIFREFLANP